jgi:putative endopeptidase
MRRLVAALALSASMPLCLYALQGPQQAHHGLDPANLDTTCAPCQDFNRYANGGWLARTTLDAAHASFGSFTELSERNQETLRRIVEKLASTAPAHPKTNDEKVGAYYASCMDTAAAEATGAKPLQPELARIGAIKNTADLIAEIAHLNASGRGGAFGFGGGPDFKNSTTTIVNLSQGGLGLPDREFYFRPDSATAVVRDAYLKHVSRSLQLLGDSPAAADTAAAHIFALETAIARLHLTRVQRRDPNANYHKMTLAAADSVTPHLEWRAFIKAAGAPAVDSLNMAQPSFFKGLDSLLAAVPISDWKSYLRWHYLRGAMPALSSRYVSEAFSFQSALSGVKEQQPRWRRCLGATGQALGDPLGQAYVRETFTPAARSRAQAMVENLIAALEDRLKTLEWMSDSTRAQALIKLHAFGRKIGYPDKWRDYSALVVERGPYIENAMRSEAFSTARNRERIGKPVDHAEWRMTTPTVNASYSPNANDITFPAGILQPPFFDPEADDAVNYGGMGAVIGHEMTHGFDDQGRQFDAAGNLRDWWTAEDASRFRARADLVARQFDSYTVVDSATHVNGRGTLGEDIADLGGLKVAYAAFQRSLAGKPHPAPIDGLTAEQRFFLAWAQIWRNKSTDQALRTQVMTDPHAPAIWRVMGPLSNLPEFAAAFRCKAGDVMVRPDSLRASIW